MKTITLIIALFTLTNIFSQVDLVIKNGDMAEFKSDKIEILNRRHITVKDGGDLFFKNKIVKCETVNVLGKGGIHLDNSVIIYSKQSNIKGELIAPKKLNKKINQVIESHTIEPQYKIAIKLNGKTLFEGYYEDIEHNVLSQGIYDLYIDNKLSDVVYNY